MRGVVIGTGQKKGYGMSRLVAKEGNKSKEKEALTPDNVKDKDNKDWIHPDVSFSQDMTVEGAVQNVK